MLSKDLIENRALLDVGHERARQQTVEKFDAAHDDHHSHGHDQLTAAAVCYAVQGTQYEMLNFASVLWPWAKLWWKPTDRRRNLVKAAALLIAEIERLDRKELMPDSVAQ